MKARYLAIFNDDNGEPQCAMLETNEDADLPFGAESRIRQAFEEKGVEYNDGSSLVLVEMPTDVDFRPAVVDVQSDDEIAMTFITF